MAAYIDREASVESLNAMKPFLRDRGQVQLLRRVMNHIGKIPAADVVPVVHGRWDGTANGYWDGELVYDIWNCSECGFDADGADEKPDWKYCPNCGARMDGDGNG